MSIAGRSVPVHPQNRNRNTPSCDLNCQPVEPPYRGFPKLGAPFWGIPIIRTIIYWGLYWGPPILGNYHMPLSSQGAAVKCLLESAGPARSLCLTRHATPSRLVPTLYVADWPSNGPLRRQKHCTGPSGYSSKSAFTCPRSGNQNPLPFQDIQNPGNK